MATTTIISSSGVSYSPEYVRLLEITNQQLSLWTNPYGFMVGVLTLLVALLAIGTTFFLYRQGADYKKYFQKAIDDFFAQQDLYIREQTTQQLELAKQELLGASEDKKDAIEERVKGLERQLANPIRPAQLQTPISSLFSDNLKIRDQLIYTHTPGKIQPISGLTYVVASPNPQNIVLTPDPDKTLAQTSLEPLVVQSDDIKS